MSARRVLVVRLDSAGDVLLAGPAVRALAADARVELLCSGLGAPAAAILPGAGDIVRFDAPWVLRDAPPLERSVIDDLVAVVAERGYDAAAILTSSHQSPLPMAMVLRLAGVPEIAGISLDHAGRLLDHRIPGDPDVHEVERALLVAERLGARRPDPDRLAVRRCDDVVVRPGRVVVHPGSAAPARTLDPGQWRAVVAGLAAAGHEVVVTGAAHEQERCALVAGADGVTAVFDLDEIGSLARLLATAEVVVTGNTGPMHLAAAVGRPVVAAFAATVPARRWRPWKVPQRLLGDPTVPCAGCRHVRCPLDVQHCLAGVSATDVVDAVSDLRGASRPVARAMEVLA